MKKVLTILVLSCISVSAMAQYYHHGHRGYPHQHRGPHWGHVVGGMVVGAVLYDIYNRPIIVQQPPVVLQQPQPAPVIVQQNCTAWIETRQPDGSILQSRTCQ